MKKLLLSCMLVAPIVAFASDEPISSTAKGISIVPMAKQELPSEMKKDLAYKLSEEKIKGYQETDGYNVQYLLNITRKAPMELKASKEKDYGVYDTHLKSSYKDIKLSFPFNGISGVNKNEIIGFAAIGSFKKNGWDGIKELFVKPELGNCSYSRMGIEAAQLAEETTEYFVNKKPSNKVVEGNQNVGFLYTVNWYENDNMKTLECANKSFKPEIIEKMIALANTIDKG